LKKKTSALPKSFDCVEFKHRAQERIFEEIKGLSPEKEIEHFRRAAQTGPLGRWWKGLPARKRPGTARRRK